MRAERGLNSLEILGLQGLLSGATMQLEGALERVNGIREQLRMPLVHLEMDLAGKDSHPTVVHNVMGLANPREEWSSPVALLPKSSGRGSRAGSARQGKAVAGNWAIVRASGIKKTNRGMPSTALVARARRLLERRGQWPLNPDGTVPNAPAEAPAEVSAPRKIMSEQAKKAVTESLLLDWSLVRRAGLTSKRRPTRELVAKAKKIITSRGESI